MPMLPWRSWYSRFFVLVVTVFSNPYLVVIMGVSGCGKSTLAKALAERLGAHYLDGDDFHSADAKALMNSGQPLTDCLRAPWVERIYTHIAALADKGESACLAFSGLRRAHRERFRQLPIPIRFFHLQGTPETLSERIAQRSDHFMPPSLLASQFASLESTIGEKDVITLDCLQNPQALLIQVLQHHSFLTPTGS